MRDLLFDLKTQVLISWWMRMLRKKQTSHVKFFPWCSNHIRCFGHWSSAICSSNSTTRKCCARKRGSKDSKIWEWHAQIGINIPTFCLRILWKMGINYTSNNLHGTNCSKTTQTYSLPLSKDLVTHYWRSRITMAMHRQACLGMHQRIQRRINNIIFATTTFKYLPSAVDSFSKCRDPIILSSFHSNTAISSRFFKSVITQLISRDDIFIQLNHLFQSSC